MDNGANLLDPTQSSSTPNIKYFHWGEGEFVNPDDGPSLVFDTKDKHAITLVLFVTARFKKVAPVVK